MPALRRALRCVDAAARHVMAALYTLLDAARVIDTVAAIAARSAMLAAAAAVTCAYIVYAV